MIYKIYVGNLPESTQSGELQTLFDKYGKVVECDIIRDFAFVHMEDEDEAKSAIDALNDTEFNGSRLKVEFSRRSQAGSGEYRRGGGFRGGDFGYRGRGGYGGDFGGRGGFRGGRGSYDGGFRGRGRSSGGYERRPRPYPDSYGRSDGGSGGGYQQRDFGGGGYQSRGPRRDYEDGSGGGYRSGGGHRNFSNDNYDD